MVKTPEWSSEEFETLLRHPGEDAESLAGRTSRRSAGAIEVVRQGIHDYHQEGTGHGMLSEMMRSRLDAGSVVCPVCQTRF